VAFEELDNGIKSCANPKLLQRLADEMNRGKDRSTASQVAAPITASVSGT
jgi:hypothetical protein